MHALRQELLASAAGRLAGAAAEAADVLRALLSDPAARIRLRAATAVLDMMARIHELADLGARVAALEQQQEAAQARAAHASGNGRGAGWPQ